MKTRKKSTNNKPSSIHKFKPRQDQDGTRLIISLSNEKGCPHKCRGCGVHKDVRIVSRQTNRRTISEEITRLAKATTAPYHIIVYNSGNVASPEELSRENLNYLLELLDKLDPKPTMVSLNTRGLYITDELLDNISALNLSYRVNFNFGVETLTRRGMKIYGKPGIDEELHQAFTILRDYNQTHTKQFGLMINFVYLPEVYLEEDQPREGFVQEISSFVEDYVDKGVPIRINLHPFYQVDGLAYRDSSLDDLMKTIPEIQRILDSKNEAVAEQAMRVSLFIGVQDRGYETDGWKTQIQRWQPMIDRINRGENITTTPQGEVNINILKLS